jgi:magnesium-transporting ATPase (P-type)
LAAEGFRVLAIAAGVIELDNKRKIATNYLHGLTFLALVVMTDPLRPEVKDAIHACRKAGIEVAMITGDHPQTAYAIAHELGLANKPDQVITGAEIKQMNKKLTAEQAHLIDHAQVFARVEPQQKLDIVHAMQRNGHYVAVTGDGANDAPALRAAQVGIAMGKQGSDIVKETSDMIITDDNFASIVAGIEEGRIAYANIRKVIFLLISAGGAEIVLVALALLSGLPVPLFAVQLLWLNLVTNGIQDVALAFEPEEGDELSKPPRPPEEKIFNRIMLDRVIISAFVIGGLSFIIFSFSIAVGHTIDEARNFTLLLMVLFLNIHVFNSRSETRSVFRQNLFGNPLLLFGTITAQLLHIGAMYTPVLKDILHIQPVELSQWFYFLCISLIILAVMEGYKLVIQYKIQRHE